MTLWICSKTPLPDLGSSILPSGLPKPIESGDVIGVHFPTSIARHPHPGLVIRVVTSEERDRLAAHRGLQPQADDVLCLMLMVSHSEPPRGEPAEYIPADYRRGTRLDHDQDLFVSYRHFDAALIPQLHRDVHGAPPVVGLTVNVPEDLD